MKIYHPFRAVASWCLLSAAAVFAQAEISAQAATPLVPGTGQKIDHVGDDFEDPDWEFIPNLPKSSYNVDNSRRTPTGKSVNGRWFEGAKRGQPDVVRRIETPEGGIEGSQGSMLLMSLYTGVPGRPSHRMQQDDFICDVRYRLNQSIPAAREPNVAVRVFLPPIAKWERRSGPSLAFRISLEPNGGGETYWPGMFVEFAPKEQTKLDYDTAHIRIRGDRSGRDFKARQITETGWWTLGMSVTADGMVHYYASPGVDDLTDEDHITSQYPYGSRARTFNTFFFNVCNGDDGRTWSTPWIIDDCSVYVAN